MGASKPERAGRIGEAPAATRRPGAFPRTLPGVRKGRFYSRERKRGRGAEPSAGVLSVSRTGPLADRFAAP